MANANGKPLRFGVLIRVSTERQERKGESLRTQDKQTNYAVTAMGGTVTRRYAGQEHATPGYERAQLDALLADAAQPHPPFDAVMVADPTRWSRDNAVSQKGLEQLRDHGIRFFVLQQEYRLHEPHDLFVLALSSNIGGLQAGVQKQKSLLNRIERARAGVPACGKRPYGRIYNRDAGKWSVDPHKQRQMVEIARRYLDGESLPKLARAYGHNHSNLHKLLTRRCGTVWTQQFDADDLNIHEVVETTIPALLPDATIAAIQKRAAANRTYLHGRYKTGGNPYMLSGYVYCGACGYGMFGQTNHNGHRYYRHAHTTRVKTCRCNPRPWVRCDELETAVVNTLFETFGNPAAVERALDECTPNHKEVAAARDRIARIESELDKLARGRERVVRLVASDDISDADAKRQLAEGKRRETILVEELERLGIRIAGTPDANAVRDAAAEASRLIDQIPGGALRWCASRKPPTPDDARKLIDTVFGSPCHDPRPAGVYVYARPGQAARRRKSWTFELHGGIAKTSDVGVTQCASHSPAPAPPAPRCAAPRPQHPA